MAKKNDSKKSALERKRAWNRAIAEGRVVRWANGVFVEHLTRDAAEHSVAETDGEAVIVDPSSAAQEYL